MIMTDVTDESSRAAALSRLGFSYGIGMVVGPTLGGHVNKHFGEQAPALVAAAGSLLSLFLVLAFVPNPRQAKKDEADGETASVMDFKKIAQVASTPGVCWLLVVKLFSGIPIGILQTMFSGKKKL